MGDEMTYVIRSNFAQQLPAAHAHQRNYTRVA
jgi:hypothetical protein